jgi:hypothetical protein
MIFPFIKRNGPTLATMLGSINYLGVISCLDGYKEGTKCELIFRRQEPLTIEGMQKFFEGPLVTFVMKLTQDSDGIGVGREDIRQFLKAKFIGLDTDSPLYDVLDMMEKAGRLPYPLASCTATYQTFQKTQEFLSGIGIVLPVKSRKELDNDEFSYKLWTDTIYSIKTWAKDRYGVELSPGVEEGDIK